MIHNTTFLPSISIRHWYILEASIEKEIKALITVDRSEMSFYAIDMNETRINIPYPVYIFLFSNI